MFYQSILQGLLATYYQVYTNGPPTIYIHARNIIVSNERRHVKSTTLVQGWPKNMCVSGCNTYLTSRFFRDGLGQHKILRWKQSLFQNLLLGHMLSYVYYHANRDLYLCTKPNSEAWWGDVLRVLQWIYKRLLKDMCISKDIYHLINQFFKSELGHPNL
jgi:hypothetical protein